MSVTQKYLCVVEKTVCVALSGSAAAWMQSWMSFKICFTSRVSVELEQRMFCCRPHEWQHSHQKRDDGQPSDSSTWAAAKCASHAPMTQSCETVLIDIAESLSFRNKIAWVFESRSQVQFLKMNCAVLIYTLLNILREYRHVLARHIGSCEISCHGISSHP